VCWFYCLRRTDITLDHAKSLRRKTTATHATHHIKNSNSTTLETNSNKKRRAEKKAPRLEAIDFPQSFDDGADEDKHKTTRKKQPNTQAQ